jgi:hypothetical protein
MSAAVAAAEIPDGVHDTLLIRGQAVPVVIRSIEQARLKFFVENPRIYSIVRGEDRAPSQEEIQQKLLTLDHVKELIQDIKRNGGLIDPVIVRSETLEVLEGNSRLAAYRALYKIDPIKWGLIKCTFLPSDIDDSLIFALLGQYHIKGKKDWQPFEQAGFLYRRYKAHNLDLGTIAQDIGLTQRQAKHLIDTYQFMLDHNDVDTGRWSFYDEYLKSPKIRKAREKFSTFDEVVVAKIVGGEIERAVDVRDRLSVICAMPKVLQKFASTTTDFEGAYESAVEAGGDNVHYKKLAQFRQWLAKADVEETLAHSKGQIRDKVLYELDKLTPRVVALRTKLRSKP